MNCPIKQAPDVFCWGQIRGMCWPIKHTDVFSSVNAPHAWTTWHCCAGKWCCSGQPRAGRSDTVSHRDIWQHSNYQQWHAVAHDIHGIISPKSGCHRVPPCIRWWHQHSIRLCDATHAATHLFCEVAVIGKQGWGPIHVDGGTHRNWLPFSRFWTVCGETRRSN